MTTAFQSNAFQSDAFQIDAKRAYVGSLGGKNDNAQRRRRIFKPTGLPPYRAARPTVKERIEQTKEIQAEVIAEREMQAKAASVAPAATSIQAIALPALERDQEIAELLQIALKRKKQEDEDLAIVLSLLSGIL